MADEHYSALDKYVAGVIKEEEDDEKTLQEKLRMKSFEDNTKPSNVGYEFRKGHKTIFPDCSVKPNENDIVAAFRVAGERRAVGVEAIKDGTVWGAQQAADAFGQGLLALERLKNLKKYRPLEAISAESGPDAAAPVVLDTEPDPEQVDALSVIMRLNMAQALLNLREYGSCIPHCDKALELDPNNTKGLWRKAKAVWGVRNPGLALETLNKLLAIEKGNAAAVAMIQEIELEEAKKRVRRTGIKGSRRLTANQRKSWSNIVDDVLGTHPKKSDGIVGTPSSEESEGESESDREMGDPVLAEIRACCRRRCRFREKID